MRLSVWSSAHSSHLFLQGLRPAHPQLPSFSPEAWLLLRLSQIAPGFLKQFFSQALRPLFPWQVSRQSSVDEVLRQLSPTVLVSPVGEDPRPRQPNQTILMEMTQT